MQLLVLGMHRSGTSVVSRLLNMAGAYFGPEGEQNPKGFGERRDIRDINDDILFSLGCDWDRLAGFDLNRLGQATARKVDRDIRDVVLNLEANRPWFIKEPRLCLTLPVWKPALELPVAVVVRRHPLEIAESLRMRNLFPLSLGLALWEAYTVHLLRSLKDLPAVYIDHEKLLKQPRAEFARLVADLASLGVTDLQTPAEDEINAFVEPSLHRAKRDLSTALDESRAQLWEYFSNLSKGDEVSCSFEISACAALDMAAHHDSLRIREFKSKPPELQTAASIENEELQAECAELRKKGTRILANYQSARVERRRLKRLLDEAHASLEKKGNDLQAALSQREDLQRELVELKSKLAEKVRQSKEAAERKIEELRRKLADVENALGRREKKIQIMRSGVSWKVTAPIRATGEWFQKVFRKRPAQKPASKKPAGAHTSAEPAKPAKVKGSPEPSKLEVDIIVCVHNALDDVQVCLESVAANRTKNCRVILVNDGSNAETTEFLLGYAARTPNVTLLSSEVGRGYTKAVNHGLSASTAPYVVLLNSDTVVPRRWIEKLLRCAVSDPKLGIVGPVSNSATWQSVPAVKSAQGGWAVNLLPEGWAVEDMARVTEQMSSKRYPRVPLLNGFCLLIKKEVFDKVGIFDEEAFPKGYGEENDFCLRAAAKGYQLAVADDCYVYHAKSRSYTSTVRNQLVANTKKTLEQRYGADTFKTASALLKTNADLERLRDRIRAAVERRPPWPAEFADSSMRVLFLLPCLGKGGGVLSVLQESYGMVKRGVETRVAVYARHLAEYQEHFSDYPAELFVPFKDEDELREVAARFNVAICTIYTSVALLEKLLKRHPGLLPAYYIQDYEPFFFDEGSEAYLSARASYTAIPNMVRFAKTNWIRRTVLEREGVTVEKVQASVDHRLFHPLAHRANPGGKLAVCAMIRPKTPRRAAGETIRVLRLLKQRLGAAIQVTVFGCENDDPALQDLRIDFELANKGVLTRADVAALLRNSDLFIDMSTYQAFGRTAIEAMASGCAAVVPGNCGVEEFAVHQENSLVVDTSDVEGVANQVEALLRDPEALARLKRNGVGTAMRFTVEGAVYSILELFSRNLRDRKAE